MSATEDRRQPNEPADRHAGNESLESAATHKEEAKDKDFVAVVYFHGMGSQRRYEETSRLIDAIDAFLMRTKIDRSTDLGRIVGIEPKSEVHYSEPNRSITYIETTFRPPNGVGESVRARFYEVYWAPIMAGTSSPRRVAWWIIRQAVRPFQTLFTPWRERQRLRRAALASMLEKRSGWPKDVAENDFETLLDAYTSFENLEKSREFPSGKYVEFVAFLKQRLTGDKDKNRLARVLALSDAWFKFYRATDMRNAFLLITILLALMVFVGGLTWFAIAVLSFVANLPMVADPSGVFGGSPPSWLKPSWFNTAGLVVTGLVTVFFAKFLTDYMGDVEAWSTYEETDEKHEKRQRIVETGVDTIAHVLANAACKRALLVSHSLGTTIAHDTALEINRRNKAHPKFRHDPIEGPIALSKIRHFITIASPIDKINYFFESSRSKFHRFIRVTETLRGDIGTPPFSRNNKPYVHWINFYDDADIISGSLQSPTSRKELRHGVDNVHVANLYFPEPGAAHSAYFENRGVISKVFETIYHDSYSYERLPLPPGNKGYDYDSVALGPGDPRGKARPFQIAALAIPWAALLSLAAYLLGLGAAAKVLFWVVVGLLGALALSWASARRRGNRNPL